MLKGGVNIKRFNNLPYHLGLKIRIYPDYRQKAIIKANSDKMRFWYNYQLGLDWYKSDIIKQYGYGQRLTNPLIRKWYDNVYNKRKLPYAKRIYPFLRNSKLDSLTFNYALKNRKQAWSNYNDGLQQVPVFHSKKRRPNVWTYQTSCLYHTNKDNKRIGSIRLLNSNHVRLPKIKRIRTSRIRKVALNKTDLRIGRVTITKDNTDQFYVSFQLGSMTPFVKLNKRSNQLAMLGYDLNTSNFLMDTNRNEVANPRYYEKQAGRLKFLQHCLSRKARHNHNRRLSRCKDYQTNRRKLAKVSKHVKNLRFNFLQQLSTKLIENQDFLVGENLKSSNMLRNHKLAKSIQSVGWRSFISMLSYKAKMYHKIFTLVNPAYTTQECSQCGYICNRKDDTHLTLNDREWICPKCHLHHIRDINASINILHSGIKSILKYLPKSIRTSARMATHGHKQDQCNHQWLRYLVTHYYGVIDLAGRVGTKLIRED